MRMKSTFFRVLALLFAVILMTALCASAEISVLKLPDDLSVIEAEAFLGTDSIDHVELPDSVRSIGSRAFADSSLNSIYLPANLNDIAADAFEGCDNLTATVLSGCYAEEYCIAHGIDYNVLSTPVEYFTYTTGTTVTITGYTGTDTEVYIPAEIEGVSVTDIGTSAFNNNKVIQKVHIPKTVTTINSKAFQNCTSLVNVTFTEGLVTIGDSAFNGCTSLRNPIFPSTLQRINGIAFQNCDSFTEITIPDGVTYVGGNSFAECSNLRKVNMADSVTDIAQYAFMNCVSLEEFDYPLGWSNISRTGTSYKVFAGCKSLTEITIPEGVTVTPVGMFAGANYLEKVNLPSTLVTLGDYAFEGCTNLSQIELNEGLTQIGTHAFENCTNLPNLKMPSTLVSTAWNSFANCDSFTEITFPDGFTTVGRYCFTECDNLVRVNLPDSVTTIGERAFKNCVSLTEFDYPIGWTSVYTISYSYGIFEGCSSLTEITIPEGVTATPTGMFAGANYLEKVNLPSTLVTLGDYAFDGCTNLSQIELNEGLTQIGTHAFENCTNLPNLKMPSSLVSTAWNSFANCDSFTEITFPDGFTTVGRYCFTECDNLVRVNLPDSVTTIGERAFKNCVSLTEFDYPIGWTSVYTISYSYGIFEGCSSLTEITIPEGVTATPTGSFENSTHLKKVNLPSTLVTLGDYAFGGCTNLSQIELNEGLTHIGTHAFENCTNLPNLKMPSTLVSTAWNSFANCDSFTEITFPDGFTTVGRYCFTECDNLVRVNLPDSVTTIGERAFKNCVSLTEFDYPLGWVEIYSISSSCGVFEGCKSLTEIVVPEGIEYLPNWAFQGGNYIEKVTLPSTLKNIPEHAFEGCTSLTQCNIPYGVDNIHWRAFHGCSSLLDLYVPTSVIDFGSWRDWRDSFSACNASFTLESEYGAIPIDYAKAFGLNYYYLSYTGRNVPKGTIYRGDTFNLTGFVRTTLPLTDVTATVYDSDGNIERQVQTAPGVTNYSLASYINEEISIGSLPLGKYTFTLKASTEKSTETFVRTSFTVAPPPLRVYLRGYEPFSGFMSMDSDAMIAGTVTANYPMTSLAVQFIPSDGGSTVEYRVAPDTKSYDLSSLNISVSDLNPDAYEMQIVVQGNGETKIVGQRSFSLTTDAIPDGFTVDYDLLSTFIANSANRELFSEYIVDYTMRIEETMTEEERFNLVMSQRDDYSNATIRDTLDEIFTGVDDADTYLIELYKKEIADFIVDMGAQATTYQYDSAMLQAIADSLSNYQGIDIDFIGSEYGEISEYDELILEGMGKVIEGVGSVADFASTADDLISIVGDFYKDYSRGIEIMEYLETEYVGNEQYQYAVAELKSEYYSNSYRAFSSVFDYAYKQIVAGATEKLTEIVGKAISADLYAVYEVVTFAETVLDEVYDIYGDSNDYVTYAVQCETYQNARAAYRDVFDLVKADQTVVANVAKLKRSFEITRLSAIRALETLMNMKTYSCIDYTYPMMDLKELKTLTIGF